MRRTRAVPLSGGTALTSAPGAPDRDNRLAAWAASVHIIRMIKNGWAERSAALRAARVAAVCAIVAVGCGQAQAGSPEAPLQGIVEYDDRVLGFEVAGRVLAADVIRGQDVAADAPLLRLDDSLETPVRDLRAAELAGAEAALRLLRAGTRAEDIRAAQAEIAAAQSQEDILAKNLRRQQTLFEQSALPQSTVDDTAAQLKASSDRRRALDERLLALRNGPRGDEIDAAVARVQAAQAALAAQSARLARYQLRSPIAGNVVDVHVEPGEMVTPGSPAITLADLAHPFVDIFVPQARAHELKVGAALSVAVDGVATPLAGRIEHVFPKTEFTPRFLFSEGERPNLVVRMRVRLDDPNRVLHAGIPAFATPANAPAGGETGALR